MLTNLARFDLEHGFDCAFEGVLQSDNTVWVQAKGLDGLDIERVGDIRSPELDQAVFLGGVGIRFRRRATPVSRGHPYRKAFNLLGSPALVQTDQARCWNEAKIEQVAVPRPGQRQANAREVSTVDMEKGLHLVPARDAFLLLTGDTGRFLAPRLGHLE